MLTFSSMSAYFTLYSVNFFVCRWRCKQCHLLYNFLDGSSVRVIISPYVLFIFLFVDGTVSSAIYYITFFCKVFSNATFTRSGEVSYSIQPILHTTYWVYTLMVNWCGIQSHHHRASQTFRFMVRLRGRGL